MHERSIPRLYRGVRALRDPRSGHAILLAPERGLELDAVASDIVRLIDGQRTQAELCAALCAIYRGSPAVIAEDVSRFLQALAALRLVEIDGDRLYR